MRCLPLEGIRVLDLGLHQAAREASRILAAAGADVVRIASTDTPDDGGIIAAYWDRGKTIVQLPSGSGVEDLLADADVMIHDRNKEEQSQVGLVTAAHAGRDDLIVCDINGWPAGHSNEDCPVDDNAVCALAGLLDEQQAVRREGPVYFRFALGSLHAANFAAIGIISRLIVRDRTGRGGPVSTSLVQGALAPTGQIWATLEIPTARYTANMPKDNPQAHFECADGVWIQLLRSPAASPLARATIEAMSDSEIAEARADPLFAAAANKFFDDIGLYRAVFRKRPSAEWLEDLAASDVPVRPVVRMGEADGDEQVEANRYIVPVDDPVHGLMRQPGMPMQMDPPLRVEPRRFGEGWAPRAQRKPSVSAQPLPEKPLAGLKVLDMGNQLAGPYAPMLLADLGAEVIKLEATKGDAMRPTEWSFGSCQRGKRSIAVDLKDARSRPVLERMIKWADVLHHNMRMPAARKLGFDYESAKALNPRIIYTHVSAYGPKGPHSGYPGFDQLFQAVSGWQYETAGEGNRPSWLRFGMMDHLCALASAVSTLLAVRRRELENGEGEFTASSLLGASLATWDALIKPDGTMTERPQLDSMQLGISPDRRLYQCADGWVLVTSGPEGNARRFSEEEIRSLSKADALKELRARQYSAFEVKQDHREAFLNSEENLASGLVNEFTHPYYGRIRQPGTTFSFTDMDLVQGRPQPMLGEHTSAILQELGFTREEIFYLYDRGVVSSTGGRDLPPMN